MEEAKEEVRTAQAAVKQQKEMLAAQNKEISAMAHQRDGLVKAINEARLQIQQLEHRLNKLKTDTKDAERKVKKNPKFFFGFIFFK